MNEVLYVTGIINDIESGKSGGGSSDGEDAGTSMEDDLAGVSEVVANG